MLSLASPGEAEQKPTYKDADYVVTHPMDDDSLPIKQSVYDEWQNSEMKLAFDQVVHEHNAKFNESGQSWKPKRQVEDSRESPESRAVVLKTAQKSREELVRDGASEAAGADPFYSIIVPKGGEAMYLHGLSDGVVSDEIPFCGVGSGEYEVSAEAEKVKTGGQPQSGLTKKRIFDQRFHANGSV